MCVFTQVNSLVAMFRKFVADEQVSGSTQVRAVVLHGNAWIVHECLRTVVVTLCMQLPHVTEWTQSSLNGRNRHTEPSLSEMTLSLSHALSLHSQHDTLNQVKSSVARAIKANLIESMPDIKVTTRHGIHYTTPQTAPHMNTCACTVQVHLSRNG